VKPQLAAGTGSNDGARDAVGLFHVVVVRASFRKLGRAMKGDHGEPHVPRLGLSVYFKEDGQAFLKCSPRAMRADSLSCILMLSVPVGPCDTASRNRSPFCRLVKT
jgi:hypothetical protein